MAFTVREFRDLLRLLREKPEWREELRKAILTDELLELPEIVRRLAEKVDTLADEVRALAQQNRELAQRVDALAEQNSKLAQRVDSLAEQNRELARRMDELTQRVDELAKQNERLGERVERLIKPVESLVTWQRGESARRKGERFEREMIKRGSVLFSGGLGGSPESPQVQEKLSRWLGPVLEGERILPPDYDPTLADMIWWKGEKVLVVEISIQVRDEDVRRALWRAETLRKAGVDAMPVVVGDSWMDLETEVLAEELGVEWLIRGESSEKLTAFRRLPHDL